MAVNRLDVIQCGKDDPYVVVSVNDCRASCVPLRGRKWDDSETLIKAGEYTFGISPNTSPDGKFMKILGRFAGIIEERKIVMIDRTKREPTFVYMPMPGTVPKAKKQRSRPVNTVIHDDADPGEESVVDTLKQSAKKLNAIVTDPTE